MESDPPASPRPSLRLLGPLTLHRGGAPVDLPPSRKVRALLGYLAMAARPATRSHLCELLWDAPNDPRGELRWCLSKLRPLLDSAERPRVLARGDSVALDLADCTVDALEVAAALRHGIASLPPEQFAAIDSRFDDSDFLDGLELPRSPAFMGWLVAERRRWRATHVAVLEHWARALPAGSDAALSVLERWIGLAPFARQAHEMLLEALAARGDLREGDEHLEATARRHEADGQDWMPIGRAWRAAKARGAAGGAAARDVPPAEPAASVTSVVSVVALPEPPVPGRRASLAVLPFTDEAAGVQPRGGLCDGLARDVITRLAKLRSMFVIAEGTMLALAERGVGAQDAARHLDVDYVASGSVRQQPDGRWRVSVQLVEARSQHVVWAEEFGGKLDDAFAVLDEIGDRIVTAIANEIELAERNRAVLKNPESLDAWEAHHRGLWHMTRFSREDNEQARRFFQAAVRLDPTYARPHAGLSFTHFQDAFLGWSDRDTAIQLAHRAAAKGLMADERDPASHWALGRALWLEGRQDESLAELRAAIELSPNFALGHYTLGFVHAQSGDPQTAIVEADHARALSPLDPLLFGMLGSRALALLRLGRHAEAADWAVRAAARPNAHVHIHAIAMICLTMAGRTREASDVARAIQRAQPGYRVEHVLQAFRMGAELEALVRLAMSRVD